MMGVAVAGTTHAESAAQTAIAIAPAATRAGREYPETTAVTAAEAPSASMKTGPAEDHAKRLVTVHAKRSAETAIGQSEKIRTRPPHLVDHPCLPRRLKHTSTHPRTMIVGMALVLGVANRFLLNRCLMSPEARRDSFLGVRNLGVTLEGRLGGWRRGGTSGRGNRGSRGMGGRGGARSLCLVEIVRGGGVGCETVDV